MFTTGNCHYNNVFYLPHDYNNYKKMPKKKKMKEEMARRPKRNYRAYVN